VHVYPTGLKLRRIEQIVDEGRQSFGVRAGDVDYLMLIVCQRPRDLVVEEGGRLLYRRDGRAQFVRNARKEVGLQLL